MKKNRIASSEGFERSGMRVTSENGIRCSRYGETKGFFPDFLGIRTDTAGRNNSRLHNEIFPAYDRRMERHAYAQLPGITHILPAFLRGLTSRLKARKKGLLQGTKQEGNDCNYYKDYHQDLCYFHRKPGDPFRTQDVEH
jgi:hypothetical protein